MTFDEWADKWKLTPTERQQCRELLTFTRVRVPIMWLLRCYEKEEPKG